MSLGKVYLVGAGPGDPKLLTLRAVEALASCDVIFTDRLVNRAILKHARAGTEIIDVGKTGHGASASQQDIEECLISRALQGQTVVRLKGGDPFIFGRGGEEAESLTAAGIPWEVVPGVSAGIAAPAYAGIPLLHRRLASSVAFVTGHSGRESFVSNVKADTIVVFMCGTTLMMIVSELVASGRPPSTPLAIIEAGTWEGHQVVYTTTLGELLQMDAIQLRSPTMAVIGDVAALAPELHWFGSPPVPLRETSEEAFDCAQADRQVGVSA